MGAGVAGRRGAPASGQRASRPRGCCRGPRVAGPRKERKGKAEGRSRCPAAGRAAPCAGRRRPQDGTLTLHKGRGSELGGDTPPFPAASSGEAAGRQEEGRGAGGLRDASARPRRGAALSRGRPGLPGLRAVLPGPARRPGGSGFVCCAGSRRDSRAAPCPQAAGWCTCPGALAEPLGVWRTGSPAGGGDPEHSHAPLRGAPRGPVLLSGQGEGGLWPLEPPLGRLRH